MGLGSFFRELKRRNVLKAVLAYVIFSWVTIQVTSILFPVFEISHFWLQFLVIALISGLGIWLLISWHFEIGPAGIRKITSSESMETELSKRRNYIFLWAFTSLFVFICPFIYLKVRSGPTKITDEEVISSKLESDKSVAVLAFLDLSPTKDNEYFSDGISEEILNYLSKNPDLRVISRTSSFSFKGKETDIRTIGKQLNANYILEGSIRKADSNLRITVQLIHANDGTHLWSETYHRKMADIFAIQDEIAREVTYKLEASVLGDKIEETDPAAYTKYLQAKSLSLRFNKESAESGLELIKESLSIDSTYAPAWLLKSKLHFQIRVYTNDTSVLEDSQKAVEKAAALNPEYSEAYAWLGRFNVINSNFNSAHSNFQKALALNPDNSEVLRNVSYYPSISLEDRILLLKRAIKINPLDPGNHRTLAIYLFFQSNFQEALESMDTYLLYQPYGGGDHGLRAEILSWLGCKDEALDEIKKEEDEFSKTYSDIMVSLVLNLENAGEKLEENKHIFIEDQPYLMAQMYAYMNNREKAYELLEKALNSKDYDLYFQLKNDPYMYKLKDDSRFNKLFSRMEMPKTLQIKLNQ